MIRSALASILLLLAAMLGADEYSYTSVRLRRLAGDLDHISLLSALPLMEEVHTMEIRSGSGTRILSDEKLAEYWGESKLSFTEDGTTLRFQGVEYADLDLLAFSGTALEDDMAEVWLSWEGVDELQSLIADFANRHDVTIRATELPSPDAKLLSLERARGEMPDLVMIQSSAVGRLVENRVLQFLDYLELPELNPTGLEGFGLDRHLWAVPFYFDTQVFIANPRLMRLPRNTAWDFNDMESRAEDVSDGVPMAWNAYSSNWLIPFQFSWGKDRILEADGGIRVDDEATLRALEYILKLQDNGLLVPMERDAMDSRFISGDIGLIMTGSYAIPYFESLGIPFRVLPFPLNPETGLPMAPLHDYKGFCLPRRTDSPILARRILQYLTGEDVQKRFCAELSKLPARTDLNGTGGSYDTVLAAAAAGGVVIPPDRVYSVYKNNMWKLLRFALTGQLSAQETLNRGRMLMENSIEY